MELFHVHAERVINRVPAGSKVPFRHTINAYRGCSHACVCCFARPTHEYLGLGIGEDFDRRIVVKVNAVERVEAELRSPRWGVDRVAMGTNTRPYQKAEANYHLTEGIVRVLGRHANPFGMLTKSTLVPRDLGILFEAAERTDVRLAFSIETLDREVWRLTEPGTPPPDKRVDAVRRLNEAGNPCSVLIAPILPGLSDRDDQLTAVAQACHQAGAVSVAPVALHLRPGVHEHCLRWLGGARLDLAALHRERFGHRSHLPGAEQQRIRTVVDAAMGRRSPDSMPATLAARRVPPGRRLGFTTGHGADHDDERARRSGGGGSEAPVQAAVRQLQLF
jgi:DNA repair photolyase